MDISWNPAQRLQTLIEDGNELAKRVWNENQNHLLIIDAWRTVLGSGTSSTSDLLYCHALVLDLIREIRTKLASTPFEGIEIALRHMDLVESVFARVTIFDPWHLLADGIKERPWGGLAFCVAALDSCYPSLHEASPDDLDGLIAGVTNLTHEIQTCNIDPILNIIITRNLETLKQAIRQAIFYFRITGLDGLQLAFKANLGSIFLTQKFITELLSSSNRDEDWAFWKKFQEVHERVAIIVGLVAEDSEPILERLFNPQFSSEPISIKPTG